MHTQIMHLKCCIVLFYFVNKYNIIKKGVCQKKIICYNKNEKKNPFHKIVLSLFRVDTITNLVIRLILH